LGPNRSGKASTIVAKHPYWAGDLLGDADLVLDPYLDAVGVQVAAAADFAVSQVLPLLHCLVAHAAVLFGLELHARHKFLESPLLLLLSWKPFEDRNIVPFSGSGSGLRAAPEYLLWRILEISESMNDSCQSNGSDSLIRKILSITKIFTC
jgi:hypothetical protein